MKFNQFFFVHGCISGKIVRKNEDPVGTFYVKLLTAKQTGNNQTPDRTEPPWREVTN